MLNNEAITKRELAMKLPIQIIFRNMEPSAAVEERVRQLAGKLEHYSDKLINCHVVIESSHHHKHQGLLYSVKIDLTIPGTELIVNKESDDDHTHEDVYVAIRDAFDAIKRQLTDHKATHHDKIRHGEKLSHEWPKHDDTNENEID